MIIREMCGILHASVRIPKLGMVCAAFIMTCVEGFTLRLGEQGTIH